MHVTVNCTAGHSLYEYVYERENKSLLFCESWLLLRRQCDSVSCMAGHSLYEHVHERENISLFVSRG